MDTSLITENIGVLTPSALLLLVVLLIIRGNLVPRSVMEDRINDRNRIIDEQDAHIKTLEQANSTLRVGNQTTLHVIESLPEVAGVRNDQ